MLNFCGLAERKRGYALNIILKVISVNFVSDLLGLGIYLM